MNIEILFNGDPIVSLIDDKGHVPRQDDVVVVNGTAYNVSNVVWDYDDDAVNVYVEEA